MAHWVPLWLPPDIRHVAVARLAATGFFGVGGLASVWRRTRAVGWGIMASAVVGLFAAGVLWGGHRLLKEMVNIMSNCIMSRGYIGSAEIFALRVGHPQAMVPIAIPPADTPKITSPVRW